MSDTDYSDSDEEPLPINISQGQSQDPTMLMRDATQKIRHWKAKYHKCAKEKSKNMQTVEDMNIKVKELLDIKMAYDKLKVESDVEKRTQEMKLSNESEQARKYQVLLKQSKSSLEDMVKKHQEIADFNKSNEAKLFQSKIDCAGYMSSIASLEEQVSQLHEQIQSSEERATQQTIAIQGVSNERVVLQKDNSLLKDKCKELSRQCSQFQSLCEDLDKKHATLAQEHQILKNNTDQNISSLSGDLTTSKKEYLSMVGERDTLQLNFSHNKEKLEETQQGFSELKKRYETEKSSAEENCILLRQAEMSLKHLKDIYTEKEIQLKSSAGGLEDQVTALKKELDITKTDLREAQAQRGGQAVSSTNTDRIAALNTEVGQFTATNQHLNEKIKQVEDAKQLEIERTEKLTQQNNHLVEEKNSIQIELVKQRESFKEEIKELQGEKKTSENKQEVMKGKLEGARVELARMEHEIRNVQTNLSEKTTTGDHLSEEVGVLKADNNVLTHQLHELKAASQEQLCQVENLKTKLTVLQEDNKNIRQKSEAIALKDKDKDTLYNELSATLAECKQAIHTEQIRSLEEIGKLKETMQERIFALESELKQARYERDSKEEQIAAVKKQMNSKMETDKAARQTLVGPAAVVGGNSSQEYRELWEKYTSQEETLQRLRSDKIIADNSSSQLQCHLDTEKEKLTATENAVKATTDRLEDMRQKVGELQTQLNKANNEVVRLQELIKIEKERSARTKEEFEEKQSAASKLSSINSTQKEQISQLKEDIKQKESEKAALAGEMSEKERMLTSEAKLRLHMTDQIASSSEVEARVKNERKKREALEEKCEAAAEQIDRLKTLLEDAEASKKRVLQERDEARTPQASAASADPDKVRALKQKLLAERERGKREQEEMARKLKKHQSLVKEEAAQRKELTERYISVKTEIGELQGKVTVLLADNERLNKQHEDLQTRESSLKEDKMVLENKMRSEYIPRSESDMARKSLEAKSRVELNQRLHEMNCKMEDERKSRERLETFKTQTENKIREDVEKRNKELKERVTECYENLEQNQRTLDNLQLENNKLKQILSEERRSTERLLPTLSHEPGLTSPRTPFRQCENVRTTQDANATWLIMKTKLNDSLNRYVTSELSPAERNTPSPSRREVEGTRRISGGGEGMRRTSGVGELRGRLPGAGERLVIEPDPARTSADSFL